MRDPKAYLEADRNDPLSDQQRREHPYDFVSLPERPERGQAVGHHEFAEGRLSGFLELVYRCQAPLHIGSGVFETAEDCGLDGGSLPVRGIMRVSGRPSLPGSSWKGAVRARFEAITASRLGLRAKDGREPAVKVPDALKRADDGRGSYSVKLDDPRLKNLEPMILRKREQLAQLSPAEALFGAMSYRGRVNPGEGTIDGPAAEVPLQVAPLDSPVLHRLAKPGKIKKSGTKLTITEVEGRKFYYDGDLIHRRKTEYGGRTRVTSEDIDHVPAGSTITLAIRLDSVTEEELGSLLIAAGHGDKGGVLRLGGYKSVGLGKVVLESVTSSLHRGSTLRQWKRPKPLPLDLNAIAERAIGTMVDPDLLRQLREVTTRRRPAEEGR